MANELENDPLKVYNYLANETTSGASNIGISMWLSDFIRDKSPQSVRNVIEAINPNSDTVILNLVTALRDRE